jgi:NADH-quinone oxidoreductase subunit N
MIANASMFVAPWNLMAPELGLTIIIFASVLSSLYDQHLSFARFIRANIVGCKLVFVMLLLLWPATGILFRGTFQLDPLAVFLKCLFLFSTMSVLLMTREYARTLGERAADFSVLLLLATLGSFFLASAGDLITLFISVEWITITLYILTTYLRTDRRSLEAGTKYLIVGAFSAALFLYGISLIYHAVGSVAFDQIRVASPDAGANPLFLVGTLLVLCGIGFKIAAFPFQFWAPDVYEGAPTPITAFLSVVSKTAGFAALLKVSVLWMGTEALNWPLLASLLAGATLLYGNLGALGQTNIKRLLAYSSIGHAGYLLMAAACGTHLGTQAMLFYLLAYGISNLAAFLCVVLANRELGSGEIRDYRGLARRAPLLSAVLFISFLSLAGIPPLAGFFGKFLVFRAALEQNLIWLVMLGAVNVIISLFYYLSVIKEMYLKRSRSRHRIRLDRDVTATLFFFAALIIALGVFQAPALNLAAASASVAF